MKQVVLSYSLVEDFANFCMRPGNKYHSFVHHYTSPSTVGNILQNEGIKLRFTRADCMNDSLEGSYADITFKRTCSILLQSEEIDDNYYEFLTQCNQIAFDYYSNDVLEPFWKNKYEEVCLDYMYYLCCFSTNSDSLSLWNYYVKDKEYQGYSIGFDTRKMKTGIQGECKVDVYFCSTEYHEFNQTCLDLILKYKDYYAMATEPEKMKLSIMLSCFLEKNRLVVKHSCFSHEQEVRCVLKLKSSNELKKGIDWSKGFPRPYLELDFDKVAFKDIIIGPLSAKDISKRITEEFLSTRGYLYKDRVSNSGVPIRF